MQRGRRHSILSQATPGAVEGTQGEGEVMGAQCIARLAQGKGCGGACGAAQAFIQDLQERAAKSPQQRRVAERRVVGSGGLSQGECRSRPCPNLPQALGMISASVLGGDLGELQCGHTLQLNGGLAAIHADVSVATMSADVVLRVQKGQRVALDMDHR